MAQSTTACRTTGKSYRVTNWKQYNESLIHRGDATLLAGGRHDPRLGHENLQPKVGRPFTYSNAAVRCLLSLREVFGLTYRQTEVFGRSLVRLMDADVAIPDYTSLQKRAAKMEIMLNSKPKREPIGIVADSTGLKVYGKGEWKTHRHGASKRRQWRKVHIGIAPQTGEIVAEESTGNDNHDADEVEPLLAQVAAEVNTLCGDGAYDQWKVYQTLAEREVVPVIQPRKNARIALHDYSNEQPLKRDEALRGIRTMGRAAWKREICYHRRSLVETAVYRLKTTFGDATGPDNRPINRLSFDYAVRSSTDSPNSESLSSSGVR